MNFEMLKALIVEIHEDEELEYEWLKGTALILLVFLLWLITGCTPTY